MTTSRDDGAPRPAPPAPRPPALSPLRVVPPHQSRPPALPLDVALARSAAAGASTGYIQDALAVDFSCASDHQMFGPQSTPRADLPEPDEWAARIGQALLEVMTGSRAAPQVLRWTTPEVYAEVARRGALAARRAGTGRQSGMPVRHRVVVRRVLVCEPADGVAEASVVVVDGDRVRALAMRLSGQDGRWRVEALQVG